MKITLSEEEIRSLLWEHYLKKTSYEFLYDKDATDENPISILEDPSTGVREFTFWAELRPEAEDDKASKKGLQK